MDSRKRILSYEIISQHFNKPLQQAAALLGIGRTTLKQRCRELGIPKWPYVRRYRKTSETSENPALSTPPLQPAPVRMFNPYHNVPSHCSTPVVSPVPSWVVKPPTPTCNLVFTGDNGPVEVGTTNHVAAYIRDLNYISFFTEEPGCPFPHYGYRCA
ncbi:hypothetical protein P9112_006447 [Eukaryota sp. TZLM1-RC]